jgi:hypothetical protein
MFCPFEVADSGLVALWDFEDAGGGPAADKSGNGQTLGWTNSPTIELDSRIQKCLPVCESLTYNVTVLQPECHDPQACNFAGIIGYNQPDSCQYMTLSNSRVEPAVGSSGVGAVYLEMAGGTPPFHAVNVETGSIIPPQSWFPVLPGRLRLQAVDSQGCNSRETYPLNVPYVKCE